MNFFISYSHKDKPLLAKVHTSLAHLQREGKLLSWTDDGIVPGDKFDDVIFSKLEASDVFLALLSPDYISSDYCYNKESELALRLEKAGKLVIIPVILRPCDWTHTPFSKFMALPQDGKAITQWQNEDEALQGIVSGLRAMLDKAKAKSAPASMPPTPDNKGQVLYPAGTFAVNALREGLLAGPFTKSYRDIKLTILEEFKVTTDKESQSEFKSINAQRKGFGKHGFYDSIRYRVVSMKESGGTVYVDLVPLNFALIAICWEHREHEQILKHYEQKIRVHDEAISKRVAGPDVILLMDDISLIGVEVCLLTTDNKTLIRQRGASVLSAINKWDGSVSGYCGGQEQMRKPGELGPELTINFELEKEIDEVPCDPRLIVFTGIHKNKETKSIDILSYWRIDLSSVEMKEKLNDEGADESAPFVNTVEAEEKYVWDARNLLIDFDAAVIDEVLHANNILLEDFEEEGLRCIELALFLTKGQTISAAGAARRAG